MSSFPSFPRLIRPRDLWTLLLAVGTLVLCYSGFADFDNFSRRGYRVFLLPLGGLLLSLLLYSIAHVIFAKMKFSPLPFVLLVGVPYLIPVILMVWFRERDAVLAGRLILASLCVLLLLWLLLVILEAQSEWEWPFWVKVVLIFAFLSLGYIAVKLQPLDLFDLHDTLRKYEPLGLGRR